jgi:prepilin-type N-terminal cleavage/methylation domain-containing protein
VSRSRETLGFTLIELLAVVAMFGLVAALVAPALNLGGSRATRREAEGLASAIELARQRAVMTGREHRVVMDLARASYWVEWTPPPEPAPRAAPRGLKPEGGSERRIDLTPPDSGKDHFVPVPGTFSRAYVMADSRLLEVDLPDSRLERGLVALVVTPDGTADPARIRVGGPEGKPLFDVEVLALADAVEVRDAKR